MCLQLRVAATSGPTKSWDGSATTEPRGQRPRTLGGQRGLAPDHDGQVEEVLHAAVRLPRHHHGLVFLGDHGVDRIYTQATVCGPGVTAEAEQVGVSCRPVRGVVPECKKQCALEQKPVGMWVSYR